jgi:predicted nucleic acid-binding protein
MKLKFYLDTSVWMDYYEDRSDLAFKLLMSLLKSNQTIVVSDFLLAELENFYSLEQIRGLAFPFQNLMERVGLSTKQRFEAKSIAILKDVPVGDAIHAVLARDSGAVLVSRDRHFQLLKNICVVKKPEEII